MILSILAIATIGYLFFRLFYSRAGNRTDLEDEDETPVAQAPSTQPAANQQTPPPQQKWWSRVFGPFIKFGSWFGGQAWFRNNWQVIVGFTLVHLTLWIFFHRESLYQEVVRISVFWIGQVLIITVYIFLRRPDDRGKVRLHLLGKIVIFVIIAGCVWQWFRNRDAVDLDMANHGAEFGPEFRNAEPTPQKNASVEKLVRQFWTKNLKPAEAARMIAWAERSSNFNQFEADGQRPFRGRDNRHNIGVMGINEKSWRDEIPRCEEQFGKGQCDIREGPGNLNMALWIFRNHYGDRWWQERDSGNPVSAGAKKVPASEFVYLAQPGQTLTVSAPVGGVGEKVVLPTGVCAKEEPKGRVKAAINGGSPTYERWPGNVPKIPGKTYSVRYQSAGETLSEVSLVFYICAARP